MSHQLKLFSLVGTFLVASLVVSGCSKPASETPPEALGLKNESEIRALFEAQPKLKESPEAKKLKTVTDAGKRAYDWLKSVNELRGAANALSYSSAAATSAPTMEKPKVYNGEIALKAYNDLADSMPKAYRAVLESTEAFPTTLPVPEAEFLTLGLKVTNAYDTAARWIMVQDAMAFYERQRISDVRGYYFLSHLENRNAKLQSMASLPPDEQKQLRSWMVSVCINSQGFAGFDPAVCVNEIAQAEKLNSLVKYYNSHEARSKEIWNMYFDLDEYFVRNDIVWNSKDSNTLHYPFLKPANAEIFNYLRDNIEEEWKMGSWKIKMDFKTDGSDWTLSRLEYRKDAYAHAERDRIVMDEHEPRTEYLSKWTIRHEFGHLLGFKDCYAEFYDSEVNAMINYALDPSDIMCSRMGKVQQHHIDLLKAQYYR